MGRLKVFSLSNVIMLWGLASMLGMNPSAQFGKFFNTSAPVQAATADTAAITAAFGQGNAQSADISTMVGQLIRGLTTVGATTAAGAPVSKAVPVRYAFVQIPL